MDINQLRERRTDAYSVSELNNYISNLLSADRILSAVTVRGEISNLKIHSSGHIYFSLKDEDSQIRAVMFRSKAQGLKFIPKSGMKVILFGSVSVYTRDGQYQIYASTMQPDGIGELYLAYSQLKERLECEGLFDKEHKKPITQFPGSIGVITSKTGAAVRDIINVITRRYPIAKIYIYPAIVQGRDAEETLIGGIDFFDRSRLVDTVIIGRGGGSIEDLWAFNSEALARRIYSCEVPVISAVGHETDFTICDFVADMRAPTPSAAAELAVPDSKDLLLQIDQLLSRAERAVNNFVTRRAERIEYIRESLSSEAMLKFLDEKRNDVKSLASDTLAAIKTQIERGNNSLKLNLGKLEALNPLTTLSRGYSIAKNENGIINSVKSVSLGELIEVKLSDGELKAEIVKIIEEQ